MKIAIIQMDVLFGNPSGNRQKAIKFITEAAKNKADVVLLPELWTTAYDLENLMTLAETANGETIKVLKQLATQYRIHIIAGSIPVKKENGIYNTMIVINNSGEIIGEYSKAHLFRLMDEHHYLKAGDSKNLFQLNYFPCAGFICYDIRFPEWLRLHATLGAKVMFVCAQWPKQRKEHWKSLLISRAIENQCYIVACNRVGDDPANSFNGGSMVIDPNGTIMAEGTASEQILYKIITIAQVDKIRNEIPVLNDRRTDLY